jgi:peptidoglycan/LPS O-acetylase OafA/YrhL
MVSRLQEQEAEVTQIQETWYLEVLIFFYVDLSFWWDTLLLFLLFWILVIVGFLLYSVYPLSFWDKKNGSIFWFGLGMYFQTGQVFFCPRMAKEEVC